MFIDNDYSMLLKFMYLQASCLIENMTLVLEAKNLYALNEIYNIVRSK